MKNQMKAMTIVDPSVPAGEYECSFVGAEEITTDFGPRAQWTMEILTGPEAGKQTSGFTTPSPTLRNKCGQWLATLDGREPSANVTIDPADFIGRRYAVTVAMSESGKGTVIKSFKPLGDTPF